MRPLAGLALASLAATTLVLALGAAAKVRIDARAHRIAAESLRAHALGADDARELEASGVEDAAAIASYTPFDPAPRAAALSLARTARLLADRGELRAALRVLDLGITATTAATWLYAPLGAEGEDLEALRTTLGTPPPRVLPEAPGAPSGPAPGAPAPAVPAPGVPAPAPGVPAPAASAPATPATTPGESPAGGDGGPPATPLPGAGAVLGSPGP